MADEVVSHAFSHGLDPDHTKRLAAYWAEALGGPTRFSAEYGDENSVVRMHSGNGIHDEMDRRAIARLDQPLADVGLAEVDRLRQTLHDYFAWATTTTMSRYHRPRPMCRTILLSPLVVGRPGRCTVTGSLLGLGSEVGTGRLI